MKHKKLNRDGWGFQYYPYYQMRIDHDTFHGLVCLIRLTDGEKNYWATPKAGRIQVTGGGMTWLQLIPDNTKRVITVMYFPDDQHDEERLSYPEDFCTRYRPSIWYVDVIDGIEYDEDGIAVFIDKYLDVIFTPEGDVKIDDRDELDDREQRAEDETVGTSEDSRVQSGSAYGLRLGSHVRCHQDTDERRYGPVGVAPVTDRDTADDR